MEGGKCALKKYKIHKERIKMGQNRPSYTTPEGGRLIEVRLYIQLRNYRYATDLNIKLNGCLNYQNTKQFWAT